MTAQRIQPKTPPLLQGPDSEANQLRAEALIAKTWEIFPGQPISPNALKTYGAGLLRIAETMEKAEQLMQLIQDGTERRPLLIEMRRIYEENVGVPADGIHDFKADQSDFMGARLFKSRKLGWDAA